MPVASHAQIVFASLPWGSSPSAVHTKLRAQGFSGCMPWDRAICFVSGRCKCDFSGPGVERGNAQFHGGRLTEVRVTLERADEIRDQLHRKYGQPRALGQIARRRFAPPPTLLWESANGDTLEMYGVNLTYRSAWGNQQAENDAERRRSRF